MTDFQSLCAELVDALQYHREQTRPINRTTEILARARAALAQPEPQGPTDEELWELYDEMGGVSEDSAWCLNYARAVLARWGRPAIEPVPVAERLPGPEDCDAEGRCWYFFMDSVVGGCGWQMFNEEENELLAPSHFWLPHHALPMPQQEADQ